MLGPPALAAPGTAVRAEGRRIAELHPALTAERAWSCPARFRPAWMGVKAACAAIAEQVLDDQSHDQGEHQQPEKPMKKEESWKESWKANGMHGDLPCSSGL